MLDILRKHVNYVEKSGFLLPSSDEFSYYAKTTKPILNKLNLSSLSMKESRLKSKSVPLELQANRRCILVM